VGFQKSTCTFNLGDQSTRREGHDREPYRCVSFIQSLFNLPPALLLLGRSSASRDVELLVLRLAELRRVKPEGPSGPARACRHRWGTAGGLRDLRMGRDLPYRHLAARPTHPSQCPVGGLSVPGRLISSGRSSTCTSPRVGIVPRPVFLHPSAGHHQGPSGGCHHRQGGGLPACSR
jgi:hypothetical protein